MPLTKPLPGSPSGSRGSPVPSKEGSSSFSSFHPFGGRVSRHFRDSGAATTPSRKRKFEPTLPPNRFKLTTPPTNKRPKLAPDDAYLSYHDIRLTYEDVQNIKSDWLTDNAIAFWQEYLEREHLSLYPKAHIVLLRPSMCFLLMNTEKPRDLQSALPNFEKVTHIFLPINDCRDVNLAEGGTHWSLLLVSVIDGVAFHYDSLSPANMEEAHHCTRKFEQLLQKRLQFVNLHDSPQQDNGMDCGVFVCLLMQHLLMFKLLKAHAQDKISMSLRGKEVDAAKGRREMVRVIEARRREGERRRSRSHSPHPGAAVAAGGSSSKSKSRSPPRIGNENEAFRSSDDYKR